MNGQLATLHWCNAGQFQFKRLSQHSKEGQAPEHHAPTSGKSESTHACLAWEKPRKQHGMVPAQHTRPRMPTMHAPKPAVCAKNARSKSPGAATACKQHKTERRRIRRKDNLHTILAFHNTAPVMMHARQRRMSPTSLVCPQNAVSSGRRHAPLCATRPW